jgi:putative tryptophan/tyrosine transport system substrate-binding protein
MSAILTRRELVSLGAASALALAAAPFAARAQAPGAKIPRLAWVSSSLPIEALGENGRPDIRSFYQELRRLGWIEGQTIAIERWSFASQTARYTELARDVVRTAPDVIVTSSNVIVEAFQPATTSIPIVAFMADPLTRGIVSSLARPNGNVTGMTTDGGIEIYGKLVQYLVEAVPQISRIACIAGPRLASGVEPPAAVATRDAAARVNRAVKVLLLEGTIDAAWYRRAFETFKTEGVDAIIFSNGSTNTTHASLIAELATANGWPSISTYSFAADEGALMSYGADYVAQFGRMAGYVDRILKGAKPGDLPIQQAERFRFAVNLKTAKRLGIEPRHSMKSAASLAARQTV